MIRENWSSRTGFILAAAGSAVGLGNIWKFPYLAGKYGGGAFLFAYFILVYTIVKAVMLSEIAIGRAAQKNVVGAFATLKAKKFKVIGYLGVSAAFMILSFYSVVAGWTLHYTGQMASGALSGLGSDELGGLFGSFITDMTLPIIYHAIFMTVVVYIVIRGIKGGIEKISTFLMPVLLILVLVLIARGLMLPGASKGLEFYLIPDWSQLSNPELWSAALGQAFFSLSLGMGTMLTYGSYLSKKENLPSVSISVSLIDTGIAFLAGLLVLPAVFAFGFDNSAGPGLTFITLPAVFDQMVGGQFFGTLFFVLLALAALTSAISILEVLVAYVTEEFGVSRCKATSCIGFLVFLVGITCSYSLGPWSEFKVFGYGMFDLLDKTSSNILLPLGGLLIAIFVGWTNNDDMMKEITNNGKVDFWWKNIFVVMVKYITPVAVVYILLNSIGIV